MHVQWNGSAFVVVAACTLARHAMDHAFLDAMSLGDDVIDSAGVTDGPDAALVLQQRVEAWKRNGS